MATTPEQGWLDLILADASSDELEAHGRRLVDAGTAGEPTARETHLALRLRALLDQRRQRTVELAALNAIAGRLAAMRELRPLLQEITEQARMLLGVDLAYLGMFEDGRMRIEVASGVVTAQLLGLRIPLDYGLVGTVVRRAEPVSTRDYSAEESFSHDRTADGAVHAEGMRGLLGVPLRGADHVIGALFAGVRHERSFSSEETQLLVALASHAAVAIDNAENSAEVGRSAARLESANAALQQRTAELEQMLAWDASLSQVVLRGGGVPELVAEIARVGGVPASFLREESPAADDLARFGQDLGERLRRHGEDDGDRVVALSSPRADVTLRARRVVAGGRTLGHLVLETDDASPTGGVDAFLDRATTALAMAFTAEQFAREATTRTRDSLLVALVTGVAADASESRQQATLAGLDPASSHCVLVAQPVTAGEPLRPALERVGWPRGTVVGEYGARTLVVAPVPDPGELSRLWPAALHGRATAGIGSVRAVEQMAQSYDEAQQSLNVMLALGRAGRAASADELGLYRVLLSDNAEHQVATLVEQMLGPLLEEERRRHVPLVETVEVYLRHQQRHAAAARELNVHVNTLYQRIASIDRVLGEGWRDSDRALDLQVVLKLRSSARRLAQPAD